MAMNKKALALLSIGHLVTDLNPGALPILLPFFKESLHLSYTMAGGILLFGNSDLIRYPTSLWVFFR